MVPGGALPENITLVSGTIPNPYTVIFLIVDGAFENVTPVT